MAVVLDHEEQEQIAALRAWWKANGKWVLLATLAAAAFGASWNGWTWWRAEQAQTAAKHFAAIEQAIAEGALPRAREAAEALRTVPLIGSAHASWAALRLAEAAVAKEDWTLARDVLAQALAHDPDPTAEPLLRLRLATAQWALGEREAALHTLQAAFPADYQSRVESLRQAIASAGA